MAALNNPVKKILFISHDGTLTGAPLLLLNLIKCLRNSGYKCDHVVIKNKSGELIEEFQKEAKVLFFNEVREYTGKNVIKKIKKRIEEETYKQAIQEWINDADVIFSNTITNGDFFNCFNFPKGKVVITYVHELQIAADYYTNEKDRKTVLEKTNTFCVPSVAVKDFLTKSYGIDAAKIKQLNYFMPIAERVTEQSKKGKGYFIVGMIGTLDWRKGAELLSAIVLNYFNKYPATPVQFLWKGANELSIEYKRIVYELKKAGHADKVIFEEPSKDVLAFYETMDVLLLCSKEDPYPLVVLEAAAFKKPCICFDKAGGAPEFVQDDAGSVVPFLDINGLTDAIYTLYSNKDIRNVKGEVAYKRFMEKHHNASLIQSQFEQLFN